MNVYEIDQAMREAVAATPDNGGAMLAALKEDLHNAGCRGDIGGQIKAQQLIASLKRVRVSPTERVAADE